MNNTIKSQDLEGKLNDNILSLLDVDNYEVTKFKAVDLLSPERFDIIAKYLFVKYAVENIDCSFANELYIEHIRVFNNFVENDNSLKVGKCAFIESFEKLISSILKEGIHVDTIIPIGKGNVVLDGAHRLATAICLNKEVSTIALNYSDVDFKFDYKFFQRRGLATSYLDAMALEYAKLKTNTNMILVWPRAIGSEEELLGILKQNGKIVYEKKIDLHLDGIINLMTNVYKDEPWLGSYSNNFDGARTKAQMCYKENSSLRAFLFESESDLVLMKDQIRDVFKLEKHALHINDTHDETIEIAELLFNENSIHHLRSSKLKEFSKFNQYLSQFNDWVIESSFGKDEFAIIGGVLAAYGVKQSSDIDYVSSNNDIPNKINKDIEREQSKLEYLNIKPSEIIYNPRNHFFFRNQKFVCLSLIKSIKQSRNNVNDQHDVEIIDQLLINGAIQDSFLSFISQFLKVSYYKRNIKILLLKCRYYVYYGKNKIISLWRK